MKPTDRRDEIVSVRLTSAEADWLRQRASAAGTSVSYEIRRMVQHRWMPVIFCNGVRVS